MMLNNFNYRLNYSVYNLSKRFYQISMHKPRRALLYVPGDNKKHIGKVMKLLSENRKIDCVALDCEDGVAINRKDAARKQIQDFFNTNSSLSPKVDWGVRLNSVQSNLLEEDLNIICKSKILPKTFLLPKVDSTEDFDIFSKLLENSLNGKILTEKINLIFYAESCQAIMDLDKICRHAIKLSNNKQFVPVAIVFGGDDFVSDLGAMKNIKDSTNVLYARQRAVLIAKAFGFQAIDIVYINFKDLDGLKEQAIEGANMGYTGKQVIHPDQIEVTQKAFLPSEEKIQWAKECLEAHEKHQREGKGAFVFRNQMIDSPTVNQAANILKLAEMDKN